MISYASKKAICYLATIWGMVESYQKEIKDNSLEPLSKLCLDTCHLYAPGRELDPKSFALVDEVVQDTELLGTQYGIILTAGLIVSFAYETAEEFLEFVQGERKQKWQKIFDFVEVHPALMDQLKREQFIENEVADILKLFVEDRIKKIYDLRPPKPIKYSTIKGKTYVQKN